MRSLSTRDKSIVIGLYLSKFDSTGLLELGFDCFTEAFNAIGLAIGAKPASIKNYRDEFDPYHENPRKGWHKRNIRGYCKNIFDEFSVYNFSDFTRVISSLLIDNYEIQSAIIKKEKNSVNDTIAKRIITGKSAEEFFKSNYHFSTEFSNYKLHDTTSLACGFDFRLTLEDMPDYYIEVKGMSGESGSVLLTENEYQAAKYAAERYCLYLVRNFKEKPYPLLFFDPINIGLPIKQTQRTVVQINYSMSIPKNIS